MTREEQIRKAAKRYVNDIVTPLPASLMTAFIKGAEYADQNPIHYDGKAMLYVLNKGHKQGCKDTINKACEWLKRHVEDEKYKIPDEESYRHGLPCDYFETDMFIDDFRKAMEEENKESP